MSNKNHEYGNELLKQIAQVQPFEQKILLSAAIEYCKALKNNDIEVIIHERTTEINDPKTGNRVAEIRKNRHDAFIIAATRFMEGEFDNTGESESSN